MDSIGSVLDRPKTYYNIDGVGELGIGFMCLSFGLLQWLQVHSPRASIWNQMYTVFLYVGLMGAVIHYGSKAIKNRITYPRTGFVKYRTRDTVWRPMVIACSVSALLSAAFAFAVRWHWDATTAAALSGFPIAAGYAHGIARTVRWKWAVVWALTFSSLVIATLPRGLVCALANHSWITSQFPAGLVGAILLTMLLYGAILTTSGGISLWIYLRDTQARTQED
jgi:hypothetical protein